MNPLMVYLLLLKATMTSFSGLTSLPLVRHDFVETRHVLTDRQLNAALAVGRATPGPYGLYLVSVGYFAAGWPGALAGFAAAVTPAFLIIPMLRTSAAAPRARACATPFRPSRWPPRACSSTPPFRWRATPSPVGSPWPLR